MFERICDERRLQCGMCCGEGDAGFSARVLPFGQAEIIFGEVFATAFLDVELHARVAVATVSLEALTRLIG
jgi:hypothetical protein